jgi:hypothetical protein
VLAINFWGLITPSTHKGYLFRPLYTSLVMLVLLILGQHGMNLWLGYFYHEASESLNHTLLIEREEYDLLNAAIETERHIVEGEQPHGVWDRSFNRLYNLIEDNPKQLKQLEQIKYLYHQWQSELSQEEVAGFHSQSSATRRDLFDSLLTQIHTLIPEQQKLLSDRAKLVNDLYNLNILLNILIAVINAFKSLCTN